MATQKQSLLQREKYIRIAGIFLLVSPFFNFFFSIYNALGPNQKLTGPIFNHVVSQISIFFWIASVVAFATGVLMIKGQRDSWRAVLALLGAFIIVNIVNFKKDWAGGWFQPSINLLTNLSLMVLVYSQEFHQEAQRKGLALIRLMRESKTSGPTINFEGVGPWAKLIAITTTHISMRAFKTPPEDIQSRILELVLTNDLIIRARYVQHQPKDGKDEYFFELIELDAQMRYRLEDWLVLKNYARFRAPAEEAA